MWSKQEPAARFSSGISDCVRSTHYNHSEQQAFTLFSDRTGLEQQCSDAWELKAGLHFVLRSETLKRTQSYVATGIRSHEGFLLWDEDTHDEGADWYLHHARVYIAVSAVQA